jgi:hypothetical protein
MRQYTSGSHVKLVADCMRLSHNNTCVERLEKSEAVTFGSLEEWFYMLSKSVYSARAPVKIVIACYY